jgi:hypothetical protein
MLSRLFQAAQTPELVKVFWFFSSERNRFPALACGTACGRQTGSAHAYKCTNQVYHEIVIQL